MILRLNESEVEEKFVLLELQGDLKIPEDANHHQFIGTLNQSDNGEFHFEINNRLRLLGKRVKLPKPLLVVREESSGLSLLNEKQSGKQIIITEKILFNTRPMNILDS